MSPLISRNLLAPRVQEIGKIKLGGKGPKRTSSGGKEFQPPQKFNHFVVTTRERGADGNFVRDERIHAHPNVGDKPVELDAVLMFPRPEQNFHAEMVQYEGRKKVWSCDGEEAWDLKNNGDAKPCLQADGKECSCKPYSRLHLQLMASPTLEGYYVFRTTSWESTNNIQTALERLFDHFGTLEGLPVRLVCYPATVSYEDRGQSKTSKAMMAGLVLAMSLEEVSRAVIERAKVQSLTQTEVKRLAAEVESAQQESDREDEPHIADEFFPPDDGGALSASLETQSTLDAMKEELGVVAAETEDEEEEGPDFEIIEPEPEPDPIDELVTRLQELVAALSSEHGIVLSTSQEKRVEAAIEERTAERLEKAIAWAEDRPQSPAQASELRRLNELRTEARDHDDILSFQDEGEIDEAANSKDGPAVREWTRRLADLIAHAEEAQNV